jgi:PTH2 family peptidyl-tRNA hydrolase
MSRIKQVILIRRDLKMRRGKEIAQGSHASMDFMVEPIREILQQDPNAEIKIELSETEKTWLIHGMAKVCLQVSSEAELHEYHEKARQAGLKSFIIRDSGRTEFHGEPTYTACAIGPDLAEKIDSVTGTLSLY